MGHSDATFEQTRAAIDEGARGGTHVWNAMSPLTSRAPGAVGALLDDDRVWCGFVADGHHLDFRALKISLRTKAAAKSVLVTDAMSPVGGRVAGYQLGPLTVKVIDGKCVTENGTLAGSALDLATAIRNCIQKVGVPKPEALRMATLYPAQFMGIDHRYGRIRPGAPAHLAIFDNEINVSAVVTADGYAEVSNLGE